MDRARWRAWSWLIATLAVLLAATPLVAGAVITAGSAGAANPAHTPFSAVRQTPTPSAPGLPPGSGALVAIVQHPTTMRGAPGGRVIAKVGLHTEYGSPEAMWVVRQAPGWLGVVSPLAGNGKVGWIPTSVTTLSRSPWELKVSLSARTLTVLDQSEVVQHYAVAVGAPDAPTPTGRFAVTDRLNTGDPSGPYGCCILALSAEAPHAIQDWSGGNRIAIHSTPDTGSIGLAVSHGCLRLTLAEGRWLLNHIPLGTPVLISS